MTKRRLQDFEHKHGRSRSLTPYSIWGTGKDFQGQPDRGGAYAGTRLHDRECCAGGRVGMQFGVILQIAFLLSSAALIFNVQMEVDMEYVKSAAAECDQVSVEHASSWVALKGPWRQACARVGGREG
jgi:hypothetical protein